MDWLHQHTCIGGGPNRLNKIMELDNIVPEIYAHYGQTGISISQSTLLLTTSAFDYEQNTK